MLYDKVSEGIFLERHKRFTATVRQDGRLLTVHVKNTGRCRELLIPGARVILANAACAHRKTGHDLVAVYKEMAGGREAMLVNIDSQAPNRAALRWLQSRYPGAEIRPEAAAGDARLDFHVTGDGLSLYVEVKGVTLEEQGLALFPDAPTLRGSKHLRALARLREAGHRALALFVIQMRPVSAFAPNDRTDPAFGQALRDAVSRGVEALAYDCLVNPRDMALRLPVPLRLSS